MRTARGILWTDFEDTCRGPVQADLASLTRRSRESVPEVAAAYGIDVSDDELAIFREARRVRGAIWLTVLSHDYPAYRSRAVGLVDRLRENRAEV